MKKTKTQTVTDLVLDLETMRALWTTARAETERALAAYPAIESTDTIRQAVADLETLWLAASKARRTAERFERLAERAWRAALEAAERMRRAAVTDR